MYVIKDKNGKFMPKQGDFVDSIADAMEIQRPEIGAMLAVIAARALPLGAPYTMHLKSDLQQ